MIRVGLIGAWATALTMFVASALAQPTPGAEAYGQLPRISAAAISPDGTKVALATFEDGVANIRIVSMVENRQLRATRIADGDRLLDVEWAEDDLVSFEVRRTFLPDSVLPSMMRFRGSPGRVDYYRTGTIDLTNGNIRALTTNPDQPWADQGAELLAPIEGAPGTGRMIGRVPDGSSLAQTIYHIDLRKGHLRRESPRGSNANTIDFLLDERGATVARVDSDRATNRWGVFVYDGETPRLLLEGVSKTGAPVSVAGLLGDGRLAVIDDDAAGEFNVLYAINRATGTREVLFSRPGFELGGAIRDPWTRQVVGVSWTEIEHEQHFFDSELQSSYERASARFPDGAASLVSWSRDRKHILLYGEHGLDGGGYYILEPGDQPLRLLSYLYPALQGAPRGERKALTYRARDGKFIPAYLSVPPGQEARNLPLVLLVHGGPASRDTMDFDWWAAFLASRGYAVLQPNFRGSGGYGASWEHAGWGEWGGLMQTDVEDGVEALGRAGIIDTARVCIVGASYGGYAALAGATLTPQRYRCAASVAGVSDLNLLLVQAASRTGAQSMTSDYWQLSIGNRAEDRAKIAGRSPVNLADKAQAPILLIHGTNDTVVPIEHSRRMQNALRSAGKQVRFVELRGDDHWLSDAETRTQMLRELETFLAENLSASPTPPVAGKPGE